MLLYGLDIADLPCSTDEPRPPLSHPWHPLTLRQSPGPAPVATSYFVGDDEASLNAQDIATLHLTRSRLRMEVTSPKLVSDEVLVHPMMTFAGAVAARWHGRSAFHAAAVIVDDAAWILLGHPASGKTTLSSMLQAQGCAVLADDLSVVESMTVLAGPRSADLRTEAAVHLGRGERIREVVGRARWREELSPAPLEVRLGGFIQLLWGEGLDLVLVPASERLGVLSEHEALGLGPSGHRGFLELLGMPMWRITRRRGWGDLSATATLVRGVQSARPS